MAEQEKTEKITINLGLVDLGQIDLLVQEGFYTNRTDFVRTAIRNQLSTHADVVKRMVSCLAACRNCTGARRVRLQPPPTCDGA